MSPKADLIIVGAPVWTGDPARPWAEAVIVEVHVGLENEMDAEATGDVLQPLGRP